jgi:HK97 family phage major capsid protein
MQRDILNIPAAGATDLTAHWVNEGAAIHSTDPTFRNCVLTINKLASIPKVSNELLQDANVDTIGYLSMLIAMAFAQAEDAQGFYGIGSPFTGLLCATGMPTYPHAGGTGFECLSYPDLVGMTTALYNQATANAKFYFHRTMIGRIRGLITTAGAPILGATANEVAGYPLVSTEVLPGMGYGAFRTDATTYAVFGDLRQALAMGVRQGIQMKIGDQGTVGSDNLFENDMVALRMIERVAFGVLLPSSYLVIES